MKNLKTLIKYNLINNLSLNKLFDKNKKLLSKGKALIAVLILIALAVLLFVGVYMYMMGMSFSLSGAPQIILMMGISMSSLLAIISTLVRADNCLFHSRDYEMLTAMPLKKTTVLASKLVTLLIINYLFYGAVMIPTSIVYTFFNPIDWLYFIKVFAVLLFAPCIPVALASGVSYLFGLLTNRLKHKNLIQTLLHLIFIVVVLGLSMTTSTLPDMDGTEINEVMTTVFGKTYYPGLWAYNGIINNSWELFLYIGLSVVLLVVFVLIISLNFSKLNNTSTVGYKNKNFKLESKTVRKKSKLSSLIKMEVKKYFSLPGYVLNTIVGPILGTILIIVLIAGGNTEMKEAFEEISQYFVLVIVVIVCMCSSLSPTTTSSISLEGKSIWILKTLPISANKVFIAKILVNTLICLPFTIINAILCIIFMGQNFLDGVFIILYPTLITLAMANIGLLMNLKFPKLDWDNPIKVIKNSATVFFTMLLSVAVTLVVGIIVFIGALYIQVYIGLLLGLIVLIALVITTTLLLRTVGVKKYNQLVC